MGKKGGRSSAPQPAAPTVYMPTNQSGSRAPSADETRLLQSQTAALNSQTHIAEQQQARSEQLHDIWSATYLPVETGMISGDANEANGYMDTAKITHAMDKNNYKIATCSRCSGSGHAGSGTCHKCNGAGVVEKSPDGHEKPVPTPVAAGAASSGKGGKPTMETITNFNGNRYGARPQQPPKQTAKTKGG